tara:strand:+ start:2824 stop:3870 length:1047 start_codon:yes stop_codon:yes gene_type:complete
MCIIASVPAGTTVTKKQISNMWDRNPDGAGVAYIDDKNRVRVVKSMEKKDFMSKLGNVLKKHNKRDILIHFRIRTHGKVCIDNVHPFRVSKDTVMAHNGMLPDFFEPSPKSDWSDTKFFVENFAKNMDITALDDLSFTNMLGEMIDAENYQNKLVFLTADKRLKQDSYIINPQHGEYVDGVWFSNSSHCKVNFGTRIKTGTTTFMPSSRDTHDAMVRYHFDDNDYDVLAEELPESDSMEMYYEDYAEYHAFGLTTAKAIKDGAGVVFTTAGPRCTECSNYAEALMRECLETCTKAYSWAARVWDKSQGSYEVELPFAISTHVFSKTQIVDDKSDSKSTKKGKQEQLPF